MALIRCPECNKEVSDKANFCIHCGFPLENYVKGIEKANFEDWDRRLVAADSLPPAEMLRELIKLGEEGFVRGYDNAGFYYFENGNFEEAYKYYRLAQEADPTDGNVMNNIGWLYAQRGFSGFNPAVAMDYLKQSDIGMAHNNLAQIYQGLVAGFEAYANDELAIEHYELAVERGYREPHVYNNLGCLYSDVRCHYVYAAAYCHLAQITEGELTAADRKLFKDNYDTTMQLVEENSGTAWIDHIKNITAPEEIEGMIDFVNSEIERYTGSRTHNRTRCPDCGCEFIS